MVIQVTKPYRLDSGQKKAIAEYLEGKRSQKSVANHFGVARQALPTITNQIFRHLVSAKKIDITKLIKDY